jgi:phosphoserine phosphatase
MFVATLIANPAKPALTSELAHSAMRALGATELYWLADGIACDIPLKAGENGKAALLEILSGREVDFAIQRQDGRRKKMLIADMDSTMIEQECIDELAGMIGLKEKVAAITARAMNGEIAFEPALRERVALLKGLPVDVVQRVIEDKITLMPGGRELVGTMKRGGAYTALVSGGFTAFTGPIARTIGFEENRANALLSESGFFTGKVAEPILGKEAKLEALREIAARLGISPDDAIAVGDGANDLLMLQAAGAGVALHAKPSVAAQAKIRLDFSDLTGLLYLQGYRRSEFAA